MFAGKKSAAVARVGSQILLTIVIFAACMLQAQSSSLSLPPGKSGAWQLVNPMAQARTAAAAAALPDGSVLLTGGTSAAGEALATVEIFGADSSFHVAAPMNMARTGHTATALTDGRVLVAGGATKGGGIINSAEIYDPAKQTWTLLPSMVEARQGQTATLLANGNVLLAGGMNSSGVLPSLEVLDPAVAVFSPAGTMASPRSAHAAAALRDGKILLIGGADGNGATLFTTDLYDPKTGTVKPGPALNIPRAAATATTLLEGSVLIAGGSYPEGALRNGSLPELQSAEIYNPETGAMTMLAATLNVARAGHLAFLLPHNNSVLLAGGNAGAAALASAELFLPGSQTFVATGSMTAARSQATGGALSPLAEGFLLVAGGSNMTSAELYGFPTVQTDQSDYAPGTPVVIFGSGWQPGENVSLYFRELPADDAPPVLNAVADEAGRFVNSTFAPDANDFGAEFFVTAVGSASQFQAQTKFADGLAPYISVNCLPGSLPVNNPTVCTVTVMAHSTCQPLDGTTITWSSAAGSFSPANCQLAGLSCSATFTPVSSTNVTITAQYPSTSGCASIADTLPITVQSTNPVPALGNLSPGTSSPGGSGLSLTVYGSNFVSGSVVYFNGAARTTTYVSDTQLAAAILATDLAVPGLFNVLVVNPTPGGGTSNALSFQVGALTPTVTLSDMEVPYDGRAHVCAGTATGAGGVTVSGSFSFTPGGEVNAGTYTLTGVFQSNDASYASGGSANCTLKIDPLPVTASVTAVGKTYDGTTTATLTGCTLSGVLGTDNVTCSALAANFVTANVGAGITVTATGITLGGAAAGNYTLTSTTATTTAGIGAVVVTPQIFAADKTYDGATTEPLSKVACTTTPGAANLTCAAAAASFATANVGTGITVTAMGITLGGAAAGNYTLSSTTATATANITGITVTASITATSKTYDGTTIEPLSNVTCSTSPNIANLTCAPAAANFASANTGSGITVTATGITLGGAAAANYILASTSATTSASINPALPTLALNCVEVTYDGTAHGCTATATGAGGATVSGTFTLNPVSKINAGTYPVTGNFHSSDPNYTSNGAANGSLKIDARPVTASVSVANKTYDGNTNATLTGCKLTGVLNSDTVTCSALAASFVSPNAGTGVAVNVTGVTLAGADAGNYVPASQSVLTSANIAQASLKVKVGNGTMTYGQTLPAISCIITGAVPVDAFTCTATPSTNPPTVVASPVALIPVLAGANLANYSVTAQNGQLTVSKAGQIIYCDPMNTHYSPTPVQPCWPSSGLPVTYSAATGAASLTSDPSKLQFTGLGLAKIVVSQAGDANNLPVAAATRYLDVKAALSKLTCTYTTSTAKGPGLPANATYGDAPIGFVCTSNAPGPMRYKVSNIAKLSGGMLKILGTGTITVRVFQDRSGYYDAATPLLFTMNVAKAPLTVKGGEYTWVYGQPRPDLSQACTVGAPGAALMNGEVASPAAVATSTAMPTSPLGDYPINCKVNVTVSPYIHYNISYVSGTMHYVVNTAGVTQNLYEEDWSAQAGTTSAPASLLLKNLTGAASLTFTAVPQANSVFFPVNPTVCQAARGQTCTFRMVFKPTNPNQLYSETLKITVTDAAGDVIPNRTVTLNGQSW